MTVDAYSINIENRILMSGSFYGFNAAGGHRFALRPAGPGRHRRADPRQASWPPPAAASRCRASSTARPP
ncbi:MAG: hypothetical protein WDN45_02590 [Caulobacteraceae bacterium]